MHGCVQLIAGAILAGATRAGGSPAMSWRTSISSGMCRLWSMAPASAYRSSSFHSTRTGTGITGVGHFTGSAPVGAPYGVIVTATEGKMPIVREIDAKAKQTARLIVDKVT